LAHLRGAGRAHRPRRLVERQASRLPFQPHPCHHPAGNSFEVGHHFLLDHIQKGDRQDFPPVFHHPLVLLEVRGDVFRVESPLQLKEYAGVSDKKVHYDAASHTLIATQKLADRDVKAIQGAAGDPEFRQAVTRLFEQSAAFRVSPWWLFWCYILATIGELCLSPVGLSMVSKLSPARFATMLMGLWLLVNFFANFVAGAFGEFWGKVAPANYFLIFVVALGGASVVLFLLVRKLVSMMHGVN
jgi:hypothetical protein